MTVAFPSLTRMRTPWADLIAAMGVDVRQSWPRLLLNFLRCLLLKPDVAILNPVRRAELANYFPQIDFHHFRVGDVIRVPLQCLWICLIRPTPVSSSGVIEGPWADIVRLRRK